MLIGVPIETERLILRRWEDSDFDPLYAMHADPDVMRYLGGPLKWSRECALANHNKVVSAWDEMDHCDMAMGLKPTNEFIGWCGLHPQQDLDNDLEIGWRLAKRHWGKGYATEAGRALICVAFDSLGVARVVSRCHPENRGMLRVFEKLGMRRVRDLDMPQYDVPIPLYWVERADYERARKDRDA